MSYIYSIYIENEKNDILPNSKTNEHLSSSFCLLFQTGKGKTKKRKGKELGKKKKDAKNWKKRCKEKGMTKKINLSTIYGTNSTANPQERKKNCNQKKKKRKKKKKDLNASFNQIFCLNLQMKKVFC